MDADVRTPGLRAAVYARACRGASGGDVYYLTVCDRGVLTRFALADVRGHGEQVAHISSWVYQALRQMLNSVDGAGILTDVNAVVHRSVDSRR